MSLTGLSDYEKQRLRLLINEANSRGLTVDKSALPKNKKWPIDQNGFFVKSDGTQYNPYEQQRDFILGNAYFSAFTGSRGCGKSGSGSQKALRKIAIGQSGAVMNPDFENLKISTWPEFREWIPWGMVIPAHRYRAADDWQPEKPFKLSFLNGASCIVKGVKDPDSARGPNINWLWFDEAQRDDTGASWQTAVASVRIGPDPQAWATATPAGEGHWIHSLFINREIPEEAIAVFNELAVKRELVSHFHGNIFDNRANLDPGYFAAMLAAYPAGWLREQEIYGKFVQHIGSLGDRTWFTGKIVEALPEGTFTFVRYYDLAATEKKMAKVRGRDKQVNDPDETVGTLMGYNKQDFYIMDQIAGAWNWDNIVRNIIQTAVLDGPGVKIYVEQEPGSGGKNQIEALIKAVKAELPYHHVEGLESRKYGDKVMRANIWFAEAGKGMFYMLAGPWNEPCLNQLGNFGLTGAHIHDDRIDSISGARLAIAPIKLWNKIPYLAL